ncbi:SpoIID/LytB domain-containing protein [Bacillus sp. Marseille-P3661]|uniref:SpoIID/LytB domain-containing protein n=1 Tax=Bacillus sp. Marseille-P3661 TaxID=1936234 RepID=UPI00215566BD|nr:SpoIID/LytB domain-containing protein [Bacillus sp. Marseille-P3661]
MISVKLKNYIGNTYQLSLCLQGDYLTLDPTLKFKEGDEYTLSLKGGKMFLNDGETKTELASPFILYPSSYDENHLLYIDGRPYMGAVEFNIEEKKNIRPVNQLLLEDYLTGVVPFEVFPEWNIEALKAQTLAARTYTITHLNPKLDDTIQFQVYGGYNQFAKTKRAVIETKGEIITFNDKPIGAFYSASNGGMTESNENVWGGKPIPYLPIKQDPYDPIQPWNFTLNKTQIDLDKINWDSSNWWDEIEEKDGQITSSIKNWLDRKGYAGEIKILSIPYFAIDHIKNESNRALKGSIQIEFMRRLIDGTILFEKVSLDDVELKKIRPMIGGGIFKSYLISSFENNPTSYTVSGKGHGHGVGMSQWGANEMAEKGKSYKQIIQHYYPGTEVKVN